MKFINYITGIFMILFLSFVLVHSNTVNAQTKKEDPRNVIVNRQENRALKIRWSKIKDCDGYKIYRYNKAKKKYIPVKTINDRTRHSWINTGLQIHRTYKYKVASYKIRKGKKVYSKRSYWVSARTYGKKGKRVNVEDLHITDNNPIKIGICSDMKLSAILDTDNYTTNKKATPVSKKIRWLSSNKKIIKMNRKGKMTSFNREGTCFIYFRAHNGRTGKVKVKVINYARPDGFPYYNGKNNYINELLTHYKDEVFNIAQYFTQYAEKGKSGIIKSDINGNITGLPQYQKILTIKKDISKLISQFPLVMEIAYSDKFVSFTMNYDVYGSAYTKVTYYKYNDCKDSPLKIAPHWIAKHFVADNRIDKPASAK